MMKQLDPTQDSQLSKLLVRQFANKVVGQEPATRALVDMVETHTSGFGDSTMPAGNALFLGPTGSGKTHVVETFADALLGSKKALIKIDCAEFQHSHEIAKLIGSPPGYLGHKETHPILTQEALDKFHTSGLKLSVLLLDEIEKASDALWSLLLGVLDKATLTLGDNRVVNFQNTIIVMTSNLGAKEMANRGIGFLDPEEGLDSERLEKIAVSAAKSKFTPEFMNRIQNIVTFKTLTKVQIDFVLEMELIALQARLDTANMVRESGMSKAFTFQVSPKAKHTLLTEGYSAEYGARNLKRVITQRIQKPLAKMYNSGQILFGDIVIIDDRGREVFDFYVHTRSATPMQMEKVKEQDYADPY